MQSERVRLRPLSRQDSPLLYQWITDRDLVVLNAPYWPVAEGAHEAWLESMEGKRSDVAFFVIEELATGAAVGTCQLMNIHWIHRSAELQIRIGAAEHRDAGLGSEAVRQLVYFAMNDLNLVRVYLHVFATNERAIRAYEKCGFQTEGRMRRASFIVGEWVDVLIMAVLADTDA
jgi:RimJ/RimL family protein N-acetyltransferase